MKIVDLYGWGLPHQAEFLSHFKGNDAQLRLAQQLWAELDSCTVWFMITFIVVAIVSAVIYYGPYNNRPERHYMVKHWLLWMAIAGGVAFVISFLIGAIGVNSPMTSFKYPLVLYISSMNILYSIGVYFVMSLYFCNVNFPKTNAYRFLKIGK